MEKAGLNITPKEFKQLSKWAEEVYNIAVVVDYCLVVGIKRAFVCPLRYFISCGQDFALCSLLAQTLTKLRFVVLALSHNYY